LPVSCNQACLVWQVCLLVVTSKQNPCVCVWLPVKKLILIYLQCTCWHHEFEMTESTFSWMKTMIRILRDFKPILDLDLDGEHMPEERIRGSKIDPDLSAGLTYTRVYMAQGSSRYTLRKWLKMKNIPPCSGCQCTIKCPLLVYVWMLVLAMHTEQKFNI